MRELPVALVAPDDFVYIPDTGTYVTTRKLEDWKGNIISCLTGYDMFLVVQALGVDMVSSEEWGKSRKYFLGHAEEDFGGRTGAEIEEDYIRRRFEQTSSLIAFPIGKGRQHEPNVRDMLEEAGFDGQIALIDYPHVVKEGEHGYRFAKGPRTAIRDVTTIDGRPLVDEESETWSYHHETGLAVPLRSHNANGTRIIQRGTQYRTARTRSRNRIRIYQRPEQTYGGNSTRLSSEQEITGVLTDRKAVEKMIRESRERTKREMERSTGLEEQLTRLDIIAKRVRS